MAVVPVQVDVAHHGVDFIAGPGEIVRPLRSVVHVGLVVIPVVRVAHPEVVAVLVDLRGRQAVADGHHAGGDKVEGKTLRPVDPVVVRVAQEARRAIVRGGVVVEHRLILGPAVPGAGNVQGVVDKEVGKPGIRTGGVAFVLVQPQRIAVPGLAVEGEVLLVDVVGDPVDLADLLDEEGGRLVLLGGVHAAPAFIRIQVQVDGGRQAVGGDRRRVEGRRREQEVDGHVARHLRQVTGQGGCRPVPTCNQVFPHRGQPVVGEPVSVDVGVGDVPVVGPRLRTGGEVVEPDTADPQPAQPGLLVVRRGAAPADDLAGLAVASEIIPRVGIGFVKLDVGVVAEIAAPPPVDEEDRVPARVHAGRRVVDQPFLHGGSVDEVVDPHVPPPTRLRVVQILENRARPAVHNGLGDGHRT